MGAVFVRFENKPSKEEILQAWKEFHGPAQDLELPSAPKQFLHYFEENDRPQPKLDRMLENGMAVSIGRLREDTQYDYKLVRRAIGVSLRQKLYPGKPALTREGLRHQHLYAQPGQHSSSLPRNGKPCVLGGVRNQQN